VREKKNKIIFLIKKMNPEEEIIQEIESNNHNIKLSRDCIDNLVEESYSCDNVRRFREMFNLLIKCYDWIIEYEEKNRYLNDKLNQGSSLYPRNTFYYGS
jgi:hypothetical protein